MLQKVAAMEPEKQGAALLPGKREEEALSQGMQGIEEERHGHRAALQPPSGAHFSPGKTVSDLPPEPRRTRNSAHCIHVRLYSRSSTNSYNHRTQEGLSSSLHRGRKEAQKDNALAGGQTPSGCGARARTRETGSRGHGLDSRTSCLLGVKRTEQPLTKVSTRGGSPLAGETLSTACRRGGAGHPLKALQASRARKPLGPEG